MKKTIYIAVLFLIFGIAATSCKKETVTPPTVVGLWTGKYSIGTGSTNFANGYAFLVRSNGTLRAFSEADTTAALKAEGTYTLTGSSFSATYTYISPGSGTYSIAGTVNSIDSYMEGSVGSGSSTTNYGNFFLHKP